MSRHLRYHNQITRARLAVGAALAAAVVIGLVALAEWLLEPGQALPPIEAAAPADQPSPGVLLCPDPQDQPAHGDPLPVAASDLIDCPDLYHGRTVTYTGEVIEAVLQRDDGAFVQLNDDIYAGEAGPLPQHGTRLGGNSGIGVVIPLPAADRIRYVGSHTARGDRLTVIGVYHRADPQAGGEPTIRATTAVLHQPGYPISHTVSPRRAAAAAIAAATTVIALILARRSTRI